MLIISLHFLKSERFAQTAPAQLKPFFFGLNICHFLLLRLLMFMAGMVFLSWVRPSPEEQKACIGR